MKKRWEELSKNALIITWSGFQDHEVVYPYYRLLGADFKVTLVADKMDELGRVYGILGLNMPCDVLMNDFEANTKSYLEDFDLLIIPGGVKSLEKLRQSSPVKAFISDWHKAGKLISSTCHGAQLLISSRVVAGKTISGYYSLEDDIVNAGAKYSRDPVVVDGGIVSSPHYDFMGAWMETTLAEYDRLNPR